MGKCRMKVVPVIDILDGVAVHAVKGIRKDYKPLKSKLSKSANPLDVATAFKKLGFKELYVADLNAITGNHDNFEVLERIALETRMHLMVDAGVSDIRTVKEVIRHGASKVIIGTETLTSTGFVEKAIRSLGPQRVIVSLDVKNGQLLSKLDPCKFSDPIDVLRGFQRMGLTQAILLDLARVGSQEGVDVAFLKKALEGVDLEVFVGGGIRDIDDLLKLKELGVFGVLLATALHSGKIKAEDIKCAGLSLS
jgi:phosphoribosylformimino-5-aminoimidazole carboxamide ribotide isomerase